MKEKAISIGFCSILALFLLLSLALPDRENSEKENKVLKQFPELAISTVFSGKFMDEFETYSSDQFPLRDGWISVKSTADIAAGKKDNQQVYFGKNGWLFNMESIDERQAEVNLRYIGEFADALKTRDENIIFSVIPAPTSTEIAKDQIPPYATLPDGTSWIRYAWESLRDQAAVLDLTDTFKQLYTSGEDLYYKTDHHWTTLGAYYAYREWALATERVPLNLEDYDITSVTDSFYGTNDAKAGLPWTKPDRIETFIPTVGQSVTMTVETGSETFIHDSMYDESYLAVRDQYAYFLSGNNPIVTIDVAEGPGQALENESSTILVVKDSYSHCFIPFLASHFDRIIAVDLRYYKGGMDPFFEENNITDVLLLYNVNQLMNDRNMYYLNT